MQTILVVNAGSSSVKFQVFGIEAGRNLKQLIRGGMDGIGVRPRFRATGSDDGLLADLQYEAAQVPDVPAAVKLAGAWLRETQKFEPVAIGHRVVHGGPTYDRPVVVDRNVLENLERYISLAPLHQPNNLAPIRSLLERFPELPQIACFDTAFHRGHSDVADHYAIPQRLHAEGVRRYGFHGLSYEYILERFREVAPQLAEGRVIVAHLGSGASMCAIAKGRSVESTMGFTALDGLPMGTRSGQIDPGVLLYLLSEKGLTPEAVQKFLYSDCGLKGLSGISNDVRDLLDSKEPSAAFALDYFVYRIALNTGMLAAAMSGVDAFVFTAGIGERSAVLRARIAERIAWLGVELDPAANTAGDRSISRPGGRVGLFVMPTNEELMIAKHVLALLETVRTHERIKTA